MFDGPDDGLLKISEVSRFLEHHEVFCGQFVSRFEAVEYLFRFFLGFVVHSLFLDGILLVLYAATSCPSRGTDLICSMVLLVFLICGLLAFYEFGLCDICLFPKGVCLFIEFEHLVVSCLCGLGVL